MNDYLKKLVSFESTESNAKARKDIVKYIQQKYSKKIFAKVFSRNNTNSLIVAFNAKSVLKPLVTFHGHLDVVPALKKQFELKKTQKEYIGRGVQDMKGACAVFMTLIDEYIQKNEKPDVNFLFTTDEEVGGFDGTKFVIEKGLRPKFVVTGESTQLQVGDKSKGVLWVKLIAEGVPAHAAYLYDGKNAVVALIGAINKILRAYPIAKSPTEKMTVNVSHIQTKNVTTNKVPDYAEAVLDIRHFSGREKMVALLDSLKSKEIKYEIIEDEQPVICPRSNSFIDIVSSAIKDVSGSEIKFVSKFGASDLRHFFDHDIQGIEYGPVGSGLHSDDEKVNIKSLETYLKILRSFINKL